MTLPEILALEPAQVRVMVAEAVGDKPRKMYRVWYDAEKQHGVVMIKSLDEANEARDRMLGDVHLWGTNPDEVSQPEEYDEWDHVPDYTDDLNAIAQAVAGLSNNEHRKYRLALDFIADREWLKNTRVQSRQRIREDLPALQRARAFLAGKSE